MFFKAILSAGWGLRGLQDLWETFVVKTKVRATCLWEHWICLSLGWRQWEGTSRECLVFCWIFFVVVVPLGGRFCCVFQLLLQVENHFPPSSKSMPGKVRSVLGAALHRVDFQPKSSPSGSCYNWGYFFAGLKLLCLWWLRKPLALYRSWTSDISSCRFFFCLDTVKAGSWSSQTQAGAGKRHVAIVKQKAY